MSILITGSNKGIGFETARQLASVGQDVIISGRNADRLKKAKAQLEKDRISVSTLLMDVSDLRSIRHAASTFKKTGKHLDVLINNAAILPREDSDLVRDDEGLLQRVIEVNCHGPLRVLRSFLPYFNYPARVINVSSGGGSMTDPIGGWAPAYCVSKTTLNAMTRHWAHQFEGKGISVNAVCPGWVRTDMGGSSAPRSVEQGAATQVWLATEVPIELTGKFFRDKKEIPW